MENQSKEEEKTRCVLEQIEKREKKREINGTKKKRTRCAINIRADLFHKGKEELLGGIQRSQQFP